jgi:hypothetical protein
VDEESRGGGSVVAVDGRAGLGRAGKVGTLPASLTVTLPLLNAPLVAVFSWLFWLTSSLFAPPTKNAGEDMAFFVRLNIV